MLNKVLMSVCEDAKHMSRLLEERHCGLAHRFPEPALSHHHRSKVETLPDGFAVNLIRQICDCVDLRGLFRCCCRALGTRDTHIQHSP